VPRYDILITNPPYSGDHIEKIFEFCNNSKKPWLLLLPNYVYMKEFYVKFFAEFKNPFYIVPKKRYSFYSPQTIRKNIKSSERKTSPFKTFWYADFGSITKEVLAASKFDDCTVTFKLQNLPFDCMDSSDPIRKKHRDKERSISRRRRY